MDLPTEFASDIAEIHPTTSVTLLHSLTQLLPVFDEGLHDEVLGLQRESLDAATRRAVERGQQSY